MPGNNHGSFESRRRGYDPLTDAYHTHHDWCGPGSLGVSLCTAVAALTGEDVQSTPVLPEFADPGAIETLFGPGGHSGGSPSDHVRLTHEDLAITVYRDGHITLRQER